MTKQTKPFSKNVVSVPVRKRVTCCELKLPGAGSKFVMRTRKPKQDVNTAIDLVGLAG